MFQQIKSSNILEAQYTIARRFYSKNANIVQYKETENKIHHTKYFEKKMIISADIKKADGKTQHLFP